VTHGFTSATAINQAAEESANDDRTWQVLYIGDWDPSSLSISEKDLARRIDRSLGDIHINRLALTSDDVGYGGLPPLDVDTKQGDTRYRWFREGYGVQCWELDALSPVLLRQRVEEYIRAMIDWPAWEQSQLAEQAETDSIRDVLGRWQAMLISGQATE
jgi:hypothetical protein